MIPLPGLAPRIMGARRGHPSILFMIIINGWLFLLFRQKIATFLQGFSVSCIINIKSSPLSVSVRLESGMVWVFRELNAGRFPMMVSRKGGVVDKKLANMPLYICDLGLFMAGPG
jgi:hypothetical protein